MTIFGVHIPELQLADGDFRDALAAANLAPGETYLELGCGHGRGLVIAARDFDAHAVGVDYLPSALDAARAACGRAGVDVTLLQGDLMQHDPTDADVILVHLGPAFHDVLAPRLEQLLTPTTRVVACGWPVPGWIEQWDSHGFAAGYVYRPGDPRQHAEWIVPREPPRASAGLPLPILRQPAGDQAVVDVLELRAGTDLHDLEVRMEGPLADHVEVRIGRTDLARGQGTLVEVRWPADVHAAPTAESTLELWARSRSGRYTARGPGVSVSGTLH